MDTSTEMNLLIDVPEPFSFAQNLAYLLRSPNECLYQIRHGRISRALAIGQHTPIIEVSDNGDKSLKVTIKAGTALISPSLQSEVAKYVREWFDMDRDLLPFYEMAREDRLLTQAVSSFYGLRMIGIPDLFEAVSWGILGQQISLGYAYTLKRRLVERFGKQVVVDREQYWLFPSAADIAVLTVEDLSGLRMTVKKCEYLIGAARLIAEGELTKDKLLNASSLKAAEQMLVSIRGIGPWTANYVMMRCLRMPSAFPIDDVGLHNAIKHLTGSDRKPAKQEIRTLAAAWTNWEAYATFYLWRFLY
ncbi:DNA-3-methyladenine glycosylase 2 [Paenibacillus woosongensis]|uniref:DNA-3-methyladenine glycosylase II n=1 Tax=Paenibacillus woosongensis TaxID=307580 RepID=A0A7X2Z553_9BACL|nr:DNA-3-methyladenine glycosylase [Paenibacillus woosongensis]MUG47777.1 DNA-3-methyladenine glycosylase [Paenibacillus woosongensis]